MKARVLLALCSAAAILAIVGCSSGLGNNLPGGGSGAATTASSNLPTGLDIGLVPTDPITGSVVAGVVIPGITGVNDGNPRELVLLAFATAADAVNGDGSGTALSRDTVTDGNAASDVFVAAICATDIETHAFSQSLAGKFRHPRCTTCHAMQVDGTTSFQSATATGEPHQGPPPGSTFPALDAATCIPCHTNSTTFPVNDWKAPDASFDMRSDTVAQLAVRAQNIPTGDLEHFATDARVLWALDSGILPTVGGRNGIADDDHDGVDEPEDRDGIPRTVPGGSVKFLEEIEEWIDAGRPITTAAAVKDVTLVSRTGGNAAGNGASTRPQVLFVPNGSFSNPGSAGTLYIVYESAASDLAGTDGNAATDVFRTAVDVQVNGATIDLITGATVLCSTGDGTNSGNGASSRPSIGGANGDLVAFESLATDIATFTDNNGAAHDVFVRNITGSSTALISHALGDANTSGNGGSEAPCFDPTGVIVAFESDASDLIAGDGNGVRDVFYTRRDTAAPFVHMRASVGEAGAEGTGGASSHASVFFSGASRTLVAFQSDKTDLASSLTATTNVYLFDSDTGATTLLNQRKSSTGTAIGDGSARSPVIGADGTAVAFESDASNIDVLRADANGVTDVFLVETAQVALDNVLPYRFSLTTAEAADANGASTAPQFGTFATASGTFGVGFATYATAATNLGTSDSTNLMVAFLAETSGVLADFSVSATSGVAPLTVTFTDSSSGVPDTWAWDFDNDGNVDSTEQNPTHTYTTAGTFTVKLVATNSSSGSSGESTKADFVRAIGVPAADFTTDATPSVLPGVSIQFRDASTEQPTSWAWDFGDGTTSTLEDPTKSYTTPGTYNVSLTATNQAGSATETKNGFVTILTPVNAAFTASPTSGMVPLTVNFDASTSTGATSYSWDFGDGGMGTGVTTSHEFTSAGVFTVTLTATGPGGSDTATTMITAMGAVTSAFTITTPSVSNAAYTNQSITVDGSSSTGTISDYEWDFDNDNFATIEATGATPASINVGTTFPSSSQTDYTIRLRVRGPGGATSIASQTFRAVAASESITRNPIHDTTIFSNATGNSNGADPVLVIGKTYINGYRRAVLRFDVTSIPSGATVTSATVRFRDVSPSGVGGASAPGTQLTGSQTFQFRRLTTSWIEGDANGSSGIGSSTNVNGGATFNSPWSTNGGDFVATSATIFVDNSPGDFVTSGSVVSDVQAWVDGTSNNGWLLRSSVETSGGSGTATIKWLSSSEATTTSHRPRLSVDYTRALTSP